MKEKWTHAIYRADVGKPATKEEIKEWLCAGVDRTFDHGDPSEDYHVVMMSMEENDPVYAAIVGNGPTSPQRAVAIAALPDLIEAAKSLVQAYVSLLEAGRDRIMFLGGECDSVEKMEKQSQELKRAKAALRKAGAL